MRTVFYVRVYNGLKALKHKAMLLSLLPSFLAVLVLCPSFLLSLKTNVLVSNLLFLFFFFLFFFANFMIVSKKNCFSRFCVSALFQSLLFEACGRTVNPVNGAVGLLWTGNWHVCQAAVETVLRGGTLRPMPDLLTGGGSPSSSPPSDEASEFEVACTDIWKLRDPNPNPIHHSRFSNSRSRVSPKRKRTEEPMVVNMRHNDLDLLLTPSTSEKGFAEICRPGTPSMNSEESVTTNATCFDSAGLGDQYGNGGGETKLLNLFL